MSNKDEKALKYCVHCEARVIGDQIYCPECGKLIFEKSDIQKEGSKRTTFTINTKSSEISRKCPGCGSIITSDVLEQCPICNTVLEKVPEDLRKTRQKGGFIFTEKKLEPEKKYEVLRDKWQFKEGLNVFLNSLMVFITVQLFIIMMFWIQGDPEEALEIEFNIFTILLSQLPGVIFGIFPIWYIYSNNHKPEKLGFSSDSKKNRFALMIGIAGGLLLILISLGTTILNTFLATSGLDFFDMSGYIAEENTIIREAGLPWLFLLMALLTLASISSELVFRGVLHNALKEKLEDSPLAREYTILMIALIYAAIYTLFYFPIGLVYFLGNFLTFALLGILYELNENLLNTIIASVFYNILLVVLIFL